MQALGVVGGLLPPHLALLQGDTKQEVAASALCECGFDGWQQGVRADGRDAVIVSVQQRVVGADGDANEGYDEAFLLTVASECDDDEDDDGHWWWQSEVGKLENWKVPQWAVLAANRVGGSVLHHLAAKPFLQKESLENDIGIAQWISKALGPPSRLCDRIAIRSTMRGLVNPLQPKQALQQKCRGLWRVSMSTTSVATRR
jgi:hypothetical protein